MHKLPVFATVGQAYAFLLREFGAILRLSWFPLLIVAVVQYFATRAVFARARAIFESGNPTELAAPSFITWLQMGSALVMVCGVAVVAVALHRVILFGDRAPGRFIHLAFGKVELLFALPPLAASAATFLLMPKLATAGAMLPWLAWIWIFAVALLAVLWIRLLLIFPMAVIERRYDFAGAWALSRGNFWRLIAVWIVAFLPLVIALAAIGSLIQALFGIYPTLESMRINQDNPMGAMFDRMDAQLRQNAVLGYVVSIAYSAIGVGLLSYAYKALTGRQPDELVTPQR